MRNLLETGDAIRSGELSPVDLTEECLARIERLNPRVNAFITVTAELAREQARQAEAEIREGKWRGPLHGIPIGLKDLVDTSGVLTTAASRLFQNRVPSENARVYERLMQCGAVLLGKQNLHEFAYGGSSMVSAFGPVRNPWNLDAIAGGSSGGSTAAVASGMGYAAIGTDTAGSIREPSSLCGVVGFKPTFDRASVKGVFPLSVSLDHVGPITRNVVDAAVMMDAISENSSNEPSEGTSSGRLVDELRKSPKALRVGIPRDYFFRDLHVDVRKATEEALTAIRSLVAEMRDVELYASTDRTLQAAESFALHARSITESPDLYQAETLRRLKTGENISAEKLAEARGALKNARREILAAFEDVDVLVTPTTPMAAPSISELESRPDELRPAEIQLLKNTRPFNVWGLPAISVPCGFTTNGLPIGLQIAAAPWRDDLVLRLAYAYEQATEWHLREPNIA